MKKTFGIIFSILLISAFFMAGCGKGSKEGSQISVDTSLVGTWERVDTVGSEYTFENDGTGRDTFWGQNFTYSTKAGIINIVYEKTVWGEDQFNYKLTEEGLLEMWENPEEGEPVKVLFQPEGYEPPTEEETTAAQ